MFFSSQKVLFAGWKIVILIADCAADQSDGRHRSTQAWDKQQILDAFSFSLDKIYFQFLPANQNWGEIYIIQIANFNVEFSKILSLPSSPRFFPDALPFANLAARTRPCIGHFDLALPRLPYTRPRSRRSDRGGAI